MNHFIMENMNSVDGRIVSFVPFSLNCYNTEVFSNLNMTLEYLNSFNNNFW